MDRRMVTNFTYRNEISYIIAKCLLSNEQYRWHRHSHDFLHLANRTKITNQKNYISI